MRRYSFRVTSRRQQPTPAPAVEPEPEPSYRDLQAEAKALGIPANQSADDLKQAIEAESDDD